MGLEEIWKSGPYSGACLVCVPLCVCVCWCVSGSLLDLFLGLEGLQLIPKDKG